MKKMDRDLYESLRLYMDDVARRSWIDVMEFTTEHDALCRVFRCEETGRYWLIRVFWLGEEPEHSYDCDDETAEELMFKIAWVLDRHPVRMEDTL